MRQNERQRCPLRRATDPDIVELIVKAAARRSALLFNTLNHAERTLQVAA
jgi:hypothetical protein